MKTELNTKCMTNSFIEISDISKAQELVDKFDSKKLCRQLDYSQIKLILILT
jgi:hypothetical protein